MEKLKTNHEMKCTCAQGKKAGAHAEVCSRPPNIFLSMSWQCHQDTNSKSLLADFRHPLRQLQNFPPINLFFARKFCEEISGAWLKAQRLDFP